MVEVAENSTIALNIKDTETEQLATEVAEMTGTTKTGAVRQALRERRDRPRLGSGGADKGRLSMQGVAEEILGYGPEGH